MVEVLHQSYCRMIQGHRDWVVDVRDWNHGLLIAETGGVTPVCEVFDLPELEESG